MPARQLDVANPADDWQHSRRVGWRRRRSLWGLIFVRAGGARTAGGLQANHQAVTGNVPGVAVWNQEVEHNPRDGRPYPILLGSDGENVFLLDWNPFALQSYAYVG